MSVLGKLVYYTFYKPLSFLNYIKKFGGIVNIIKIERGKLAMYKASAKLCVPHIADNVFEVFFLTGKKYWPLTAYCAYSLIKASDTPLRPVFIDDGSFSKKFIKKAKKQFPGCAVKTNAEIEEHIRICLPADKFPLLNRKRKTYPHIRKLTDIHAGSKGWKLVLDSDMLFFSDPKEVINWLQNPYKPFFLHDAVSSYHYSLPLMEELTGHPIYPNINVGAAGIKSDDINWTEIESWIKTLEQKEGENYLLEQALSAMISSKNPIIANKNRYIVMPDETEAKHPTAALHHYVATAKEWYYKTAWRAID